MHLYHRLSLTLIVCLLAVLTASAQERMIQGTVVQFENSQVTVDHSGTHTTVTIIPATTGDVARIAVGQIVKVTYVEADKLVARDIRIVPRQ